MNKKTKFSWLCVVLCLCLVESTAVFFGQNRQAYTQSTIWWQVELSIKVTGTYHLQVNNTVVDSKYSFTATVLGSLEEDEDDDYIYFQVLQDVKNLQWLETITNQQNGEKSNQKPKVTLEPTVNYVYHDHGQLIFDFSIKSVDVPVAKTPLKITLQKLQLPESAGEASVNNKAYQKGLSSGSNHVVLDKKAIYKNPVFTRSYTWAWQEHQASWQQEHEVVVNLKLLRSAKK